jgi:hypothetical protein
MNLAAVEYVGPTQRGRLTETQPAERQYEHERPVALRPPVGTEVVGKGLRFGHSQCS